MRVSVDPEKCHGHQMCAIAAPEVFGSDDYGNAVVLLDPVPSDLEASARRARSKLPGARDHAPRRRLSAMNTNSSPTDWTHRLRHLRPGLRSRPVPDDEPDPRVGLPDRPHRTVGRLVDADAVRRHRRRRPGTRHLHVAQHHRRASAHRPGRRAVRRGCRAADHLGSARNITGIVARSCRRSHRRQSPSTRTAPGRCATS